MGRAPCCDKANVKRGPWSPEEDATLKNYLQRHGTCGNWIALPHKAGLKRCGKSCRLRWLNYLRPDIKHGGFTEVEDNIICNLYKSIGSRWSVIASQLPGRTDNDVKNYWNTKLKKKLLAGKASFTSNNTDISTNSDIQTSTAPSPSLLTKGKFDNYGLLACLGQNSTTLPSPTEVGLRQPVDSHGMFSDPIHFVPEFGPNTSNNDNIFSSSQEVSGLVVPSSFASEENYFSWSGNGGIEDSQFLVGFGNGSSYDLNGYGFQEIITSTEAAPNLANFDNFFANTSDHTKKKELYESVI